MSSAVRRPARRGRLRNAVVAGSGAADPILEIELGFDSQRATNLAPPRASNPPSRAGLLRLDATPDARCPFPLGRRVHACPRACLT
eukprot:29120-Pelagococcus_subviridis.AAC.21